MWTAFSNAFLTYHSHGYTTQYRCSTRPAYSAGAVACEMPLDDSTSCSPKACHLEMLGLLLGTDASDDSYYSVLVTKVRALFSTYLTMSELQTVCR